MSQKKLDILVIIRETCDPRPPAGVTARGAGIGERGLRRMPNPSDLSALEEALCLKDRLGAAVVTALAVGPARLDDTLRLAHAMGAERLIRVWDDGMAGGDAVAEARVLARVVAILAPALVFSGNRLEDRGDDPAPALAAAANGLPCIGAALSISLNGPAAEVLRRGDRGARLRVSAPLPCAILFDSGRTPRYPSLEAVTDALTAGMETWGMAELGLPFREIGASGAYLGSAEFGVPRPDPVRAVTPDAELPAFERILSLLSGGLKSREGKRHVLSGDETAAGIWRILADEGFTARGVT